MSKLTNEQIIESLSSKTALELNELSKSIQEYFGIESISFGSGGNTGAGSEAAAVSSEYDVQIKAVSNKLGAIKFIKTYANLGLAEAKTYIEDEARKSIGELMNKVFKKDEADKLVADLTAEGATAVAIAK